MCFRHAFLLSVIALTSSVAPVFAGQGRPKGDLSRDVRQTMQARKLLANDPELSAWNIGVVVTDRVAVLWGPAPSADIALRAEMCLKAMLDLVEVRNEMIILESIEPASRPSAVDAVPRVVPELLPPRLPGEAKSKPVPPEQTTSASKKPIELMTPLPDIDHTLTALVRSFLQTKASYSVVQFAVKDGRVFLSASNQDADVLHDAARGIARLPNVDSVIVLDKLASR